MKKRLIYPDFCKFFAIFLVTCSHCAQQIQGDTWTNFMGGTELDIAVAMPLFMLLSGWFLNLDKMRTQRAKDYVSSKFKHLVVPALVWYVVYCVFTISRPTSVLSSLSFYWYLVALFVCLCIIFFTSKLIKNNVTCAAVSILLVLCCPYSDYSHINFMMPFIWAGYASRKLLQSKYSGIFAIVSLILAIILMPYWSKEQTVYISPLNSLFLTQQMVITYLYRFIIGVSMSIPIIYLAMKLERNKIVCSLAKLGGGTLLIYTMSFVINRDIGRIINHLGLHVSQYIVIDILSILACCIIIFLCTIFAKWCRKNKYRKLLFLGE